MSSSVLASAVISAVPKLTASNYYDWRFAVEMVFRGRDCYEVATGLRTKAQATDAAEWDRHAQGAFVIIGLTVDPSQYPYIRTPKVTNGPEAWQALKEIYEKNSRANRISLKRAFYAYEHDVALPIQDYITGVTTSASRLQSIGITLSDEDIADVLIFNLDASYENIAGALTATRGTLTVADISGALIDEEARRGGLHLESALVSHELPNRGKRTRESDSRRTVTCYACGRKGHVAYDCPDRADRREEKEEEEGEKPKKSSNRSYYASEEVNPPVEDDLPDYVY